MVLKGAPVRCWPSLARRRRARNCGRDHRAERRHGVGLSASGLAHCWNRHRQPKGLPRGLVVERPVEVPTTAPASAAVARSSPPSSSHGHPDDVAVGTERRGSVGIAASVERLAPGLSEGAGEGGRKSEKRSFSGESETVAPFGVAIATLYLIQAQKPRGIYQSKKWRKRILRLAARCI